MFLDVEVEKIDDQFRKLHLARSKVDFHKFCKMHKDVPLLNHLNSVGAHLEVSLKTCKGFVGPLQALCWRQAALNLISP